MRKSFLLLAGALLFLMQVAFAQKTVTGKIAASKGGAALIGATIQVKGTNISTASDENGNFSVAVPANRSTLVVTYLGYKRLEVNVDNASLNTNGRRCL